MFESGEEEMSQSQSNEEESSPIVDTKKNEAIVQETSSDE